MKYYQGGYARRQTMMRAAMERYYEKYLELGLDPEEAREQAEYDAEVEHDTYCENLMDERRLERE